MSVYDPVARNDNRGTAYSFTGIALTGWLSGITIGVTLQRHGQTGVMFTITSVAGSHSLATGESSSSTVSIDTSAAYDLQMSRVGTGGNGQSSSIYGQVGGAGQHAPVMVRYFGGTLTLRLLLRDAGATEKLIYGNLNIPASMNTVSSSLVAGASCMLHYSS